MKMYISENIENVEALNNKIHYSLFVSKERYLANRYSPIFFNEETKQYGIVIDLNEQIKGILTEEEKKQITKVNIEEWSYI